MNEDRLSQIAKPIRLSLAKLELPRRTFAGFAILEAIDQFVGGADQFDDMTLVILRHCEMEPVES